MNLDKLLNRTIEISKRAGAFIREERRHFDTSKIEYKGKNDLVSYVDKQAEKILFEELSSILPQAGFIAEEGTGERKELNWVIDPLDGTTNFMHGLPPYSVSIALMNGNDILLGVIYEITSNECYFAHNKSDAYCDGQKISVSKIQDFKDGLYLTGFPYRDFSKMESYYYIMNHFLENTHGLRRFGSAAADLAYVASGKCEGFFEFFLSPWDVAAGCLIVQKAGGRITDFKGGDNYIFGKEIIAGSYTQPEMQKIIDKYWNDSN